MRVERLAGSGFRNLEAFDLQVPFRFVVLHGPNAQGKTNALEAVHLLATLKPFRARHARELIQFGEEEAALGAWVLHEGLTRRYRLEIGPEKRTMKLDGKVVFDHQEYFAGIRAIAFAPADAAIVTGEPELRRAWIDRAAFTARPAHLDLVRTHRRLLRQKTAVLKEETPDPALLDVLDAQLAQAGAELAERRSRMLATLLPNVRRVHREISGGAGTLELNHRTRAEGGDLEERARTLFGRQLARRPEEIRMRRVLEGPQSDDVLVALDSRAARSYASQGQVRSIVLALKLGELLTARERGDSPLFLFDDVSSELDRGRTASLVAFLRELDVQVFATTTDARHLTGLPRDDTQFIQVNSGKLST